jgi:hypothetical protein
VLPMTLASADPTLQSFALIPYDSPGIFEGLPSDPAILIAMPFLMRLGGMANNIECVVII